MGCLKRLGVPLLLGALVSVPLLGLFFFVQAQPPPTIPGATFVGSEQCKTCHSESSAKYWKTNMGKIFLKSPRNELEKRDCESCHGPSSKHIQNPADPKNNIRFGKKAAQTLAEQNAVCQQCHERGGRLFWKASSHEARNVACANCHKVMENVSDKNQFTKKTEMEVCSQCHQVRQAQLMRSSHMPYREGKMTCSNCHNPHGTPTPKLIIENSVNENCYKCHPERRGPFLWEHAAVRENCLNCHEAHGSNNPQLLKVRQPLVCRSCHIPSRHPTQPHLPSTRFVFNRSCANCHPQIHGSNSPSGVFFLR